MSHSNENQAQQTGESIPPDENKLIAERREKLNALRAHGNAFPSGRVRR